MYTGSMDIASIFVYLLMGFFGFFCIKKAMTGNGEVRLFSPRVVFPKRYLAYVAFVAVFTFFASFRLVAENVGGADAENYVQIFLQSLNPEFTYLDRVEPGYLLYCQAIRLFTDDHKVFFAISHGIIAISYCLFVEKYCPKNGSAVPFVLLVFLYLKSFCTLRSSLAVAVLLLALVYSDKNRWISVLLMIGTVFIHRMSIAYAVFPVFYFLFKKVINRLSGIFLAGFVFAFGLLGVFAARGVQFVISEWQILDALNTSYLTRNEGVSLFTKIPTLLPHILLFAGMTVFSRKLEQTETTKTIKIICCYDLIIFPAALILGFWRANEYLYVARLVMWSMLIPHGESLVKQLIFETEFICRNRIVQKIFKNEQQLACVYRLGVAAAFWVWLIFRIYSEWNSLKIMPYILDLF